MRSSSGTSIRPTRPCRTSKAASRAKSIRISGEDAGTLRAAAERVKQVDPDRANLAGLSNTDVASSSATAINGASLTTVREGDKQIPVVARLRYDETPGLNAMNNLYVYSRTGKHKIPLRQPFCYAEIGGLTAATVVTLLLAPVFYAICVLDLKIVKWAAPAVETDAAAVKDVELSPSSGRACFQAGRNP